MTASIPELSIVLATDDYATIRRTLHGLQSADRARLEIVIAALSGARLAPEAPELRGFARVRVVAADAGIDIARAEAAAVAATSAPYVVFAESCAFPCPGFVEAIARACRSAQWDVVGPAMRNANPGSATSWAAMRINYGRWMDNPPRGLCTDVPGHNTAYKREALLALGSELEDLMQSLTSVQQALGARGGAVYLEPSAEVEMLNVSKPGWYLIDQAGKGRQYATLRCRRWPLARRIAYAAGTPLIPMVRLARIVSSLRQAGGHQLWRGLRPVSLLAGLVASAAGECMGYAVGGRASHAYFERNLHRPRYLRARDREQDARPVGGLR